MPEVVRSRSNPAYKRLSALKRGRGEDGLLLLEGPKLIQEALAAGLSVVEVAVSEGAAAREKKLLQRLDAGETKLRWMDERLIESLSELEASQGLLALARAPCFDPDRIFERVPLVVVAVGIQNPGNLGGLLRTAEAAGATGAWLSEGCADPFAWKTLRGSMGSVFRVPQRRQVPVASLIDELRKRGVASVAAATDAEQRYDEVDLRRPVALLFGNEGAGLPAAVERAADRRVSIPLQGEVESLNVGVAAGVLLFEAARQRRHDGA